MKETITARTKEMSSALTESASSGASSSRKSLSFKFEISNSKSTISNLKYGILPLCLFVSAALFLSACGYHVGGTASTLPPGLKVIAVPALKNDTTRYRVEQRMTEAVVHEFIARTKYRIVSTEDSADAVLHGEITNFEAIPAVFDTTPATSSSTSTVPPVNVTTARATTMLISVHMKVLLQESGTNKVLYKNDDYLFREPYEISTDPSRFFDEQGPALDRVSRDFAARLVSDVLENF
ncbi:MAG TPA: LPS assembly lipoprotein LptE [Candidatus Acidoferrales bacterium]